MIRNKIKRVAASTACVAAGALALTSCSLDNAFVLGGGGREIDVNELETFEGTKNSIFFALYNYYGYEGQHFTNKWMGMNDALAEYGITVTGWESQKNATKFNIKREADCKLPEDAEIYMVNNQQWDTGIQFTKPIAKYKPMAIISTCNGVEFASGPIAASGIEISNATMAGFSDGYKQAFQNGTLRYISAKYAAHPLPIIAAAVDAVDNGTLMRNADGTALHMSIKNWAIQTMSDYEEMEKVDSIDPKHPTLRNVNIKDFFDKSSSSYGAEKLSSFVADSSEERMKELYTINGSNEASDTARTGRKLKVGIIIPSSVNDQVKKYNDYIKGYCAQVYNYSTEEYSVTSTNTQDKCAETAVAAGCDIIISLQDDTARNKAIKIANDSNVYFGIVGTTQNPIDYEQVKNLPYYVGSVGTSIEEERRAAYEMTKYYLECMVRRNISPEALREFQIEYLKNRG